MLDVGDEIVGGGSPDVATASREERGEVPQVMAVGGDRVAGGAAFGLQLSEKFSGGVGFLSGSAVGPHGRRPRTRARTALAERGKHTGLYQPLLRRGKVPRIAARSGAASSEAATQ